MTSPSSHSVCALLMVVALPLAAQDASAARDERFGVMTHFAHGWDPAIIPLVARSGVGGVRDELYWREVEPQKGTFTFPERYDRTMAALKKNNLSPFVVLSFENDHYDGGDTPHTDEAIAGFARYAVEVLRHYGKQIKAVEVWNEFNGTFVRGPAESDRAGTYLRLLRATYAAVKQVRPDVIVVAGATAGVPLPYWEKLLAGGALACADALSVHPYRYDSPPEGIETEIAELATLAARYSGGTPKPIWVTEVGWQVRPAKAPGDLVIDEMVQARFLVRAYALLFSANAERVYWYLFRDYNGLTMGLVRSDEQTPKPAFTAMAVMAQQLRDARFVARDRTAPEIYSIHFRRPNGEAVRVMWSLQPRRVALAGVTGVSDLLGQVVAFDGVVELTESPLFVTGELSGLPAPTTEVIADARAGFSGVQGKDGWSYGYLLNDESGFARLPNYGADDWHAAWRGDPPYLSVTSADQHPSSQNGMPVASVRRWESDREGNVRIAGSFRGGKYGGDGLGVAIAVNGQRRFRKLLGGNPATSVAENFDFVQSVQVGTTIDFIVDPGPGANLDYDGTAVAVTISTTP